MSSFGEALDLIGLHGTNPYNPSNLAQNCVFVTIAYLLNMSSNQLALTLHQDMTTHGARTIEEVFSMLTESRRAIGAFNHRLARNEDDQLRKQEPLTVPIQAGHVHQMLRLNDRARRRGVGVGYFREDGTGHCLIVQAVQMDREHLNGLKYVCVIKFMLLDGT